MTSRKRKLRKTTLDKEALKCWRKVLPGVPDEQIVIPRYLAKHYLFSPSSQKSDDPAEWEYIRTLLYQATTFGIPAEKRIENAQSHRRMARNTAARAFRWWDSLGEPTPLKMNQSLYTHRNMWNNPLDLPEFYICWSLCIAWFLLPERNRSAAAAKAKIRAMLNELRREYL